MATSEAALKPAGVHLVGSVPFASAADVFIKTTIALPDRLLRIPDGETSRRQSFVMFQRDVFASMPHILRNYDEQFNSVPTPQPDPLELSSISTALANAHSLRTHYDEHALDSYTTFASLRSSGAIPPRVKFQVSLPTPLNVLALIADGYQATIEPFYEQALVRAIKNLEASIPRTDLSIQWDAAAEFAMLEGAYWPHFKPFFSPVKAGVIERLIRLANFVDPQVECGFHLCYGDIRHKHFAEPENMGYLVEVASAILERSKRDITWIHMPVPKDRTDKEYFAPLEKLDLGKTALFLGVVHFDDLIGTQQRIESATTTGKAFGIATECGMGRTPPEHLESILKISAAVSAPYSRTD